MHWVGEIVKKVQTVWTFFHMMSLSNEQWWNIWNNSESEASNFKNILAEIEGKGHWLKGKNNYLF